MKVTFLTLLYVAAAVFYFVKPLEGRYLRLKSKHAVCGQAHTASTMSPNPE
jgi:hypothetical protein